MPSHIFVCPMCKGRLTTVTEEWLTIAQKPSQSGGEKWRDAAHLDCLQRMGDKASRAMPEIIRIKPHHFIDILTTYGAGTTSLDPHPYGHAQHIVSSQILDNPDVMLEMELGADEICTPCMHNIDGLCDDVIDISYRPRAPSSKREWNLLIDWRWCTRLDLGQDDRLSARALAERILDRAGDITGIYREIPPGPTAERMCKLGKGIVKFLKGIT